MRVELVGQSGAVSESDMRRGRAEAEQRPAVVSAIAPAVSKLEAEERSKEKNHEARLARLNSQCVLLKGEIATTAADLKWREHEIEKRRIRAPVGGQVAEVADRRIGSYVEEGDRFGAIVPDGGLRAVAYFPPYAALGRIRIGQFSRLRLDGFPWAQYGTVPARVANVAGEPGEGEVRVELAIDTGSNSRIPLQHGLPGMVEVKVDRVTPFTLVVRTTGRLLSAPAQKAGLGSEGSP